MEAVQAAAIEYSLANDDDGASQGDAAAAAAAERGRGAFVVPVATSVMAEAALLASARAIQADQTVRYLMKVAADQAESLSLPEEDDGDVASKADNESKDGGGSKYR